mmetsp:Transcript_35159/g.60671  ORF Transcript_35159/g.60671 Transcript_35159/m.60671 type:complete len:261 (+) Transcript_35159:108-890(+)
MHLDHLVVRLVLVLVPSLSEALVEVLRSLLRLLRLDAVVHEPRRISRGAADREEHNSKDCLLRDFRELVEEDDLLARTLVTIAHSVVGSLLDSEAAAGEHVIIGTRVVSQTRRRALVVRNGVTLAVGRICALCRGRSARRDAHAGRRDRWVGPLERERRRVDLALLLGAVLFRAAHADVARLVTVAEVIVARREVGKLARLPGIHDASVEVRVRFGVELSAVERVVLALLLVVDVGAPVIPQPAVGRRLDQLPRRQRLPD